ncbi:MAG: ComF family protein [Anaerolineae bacterium]|nr:ComF family protein [Anaerolineae bacterium]
MVCQEHPLQVNPVRSAFLFEEPIRSAIHALKYRGGVQVIDALAEPLKKAWCSLDMTSDLLIPVPLHKRREARRGYNQALVLAHALGAQLNLPTASRALQRVRDTASQTRLNREARRQNVADAFAVFPGLDLTGLVVTLVDDVATTGATLNACAVVLLEAGAKAVNAFTLARAP